MDALLSTAKGTTEWLQSGGGWAMFVLVCGVLIYLWRHLVAERKAAVLREDGLREAHKAELDKLVAENRKELKERDDRIFGLLDKTNDLLSAVQQIDHKR